MSAGAFVNFRYEQNNGLIRNCRVQPETTSAQIEGVVNSGPSGVVSGTGTVYIRNSRRKFGVYARRITVEFTGVKPAGYSGESAVIPIFRQSVFDGISVGDTGEYLGVPVRVVSTSAESIR
jgi:hypothetical protein